MVPKKANHLKKILILKNQLNSRTLEAATPYARLLKTCHRKLNSVLAIIKS